MSLGKQEKNTLFAKKILSASRSFFNKVTLFFCILLLNYLLLNDVAFKVSDNTGVVMSARKLKFDCFIE